MKIYIVLEYTSQESVEQTVYSVGFKDKESILMDYKARLIPCKIEGGFLIHSITEESLGEIVEIEVEDVMDKDWVE